MWYPKESRIKEITTSLEKCETLILEHSTKFDEKIRLFSDVIVLLAKSRKLPKHQIRNWIWTASQYRLYAEKDLRIAGIAGRAIYYLAKNLINERDNPGLLGSTEDLECEIDWVLSKTVFELAGILGYGSLQSFLSPEESNAVEKRLEELSNHTEPLNGRYSTEFSVQLGQLGSVASRPYILDLSDKIHFLVKQSGNGSTDSKKSQAALLYLAEQDDVVPDTLGLLGLVDDIHAIEKTYAEITGITSWLPVLQAFIGRWPFIQDLMVKNKDGRVKPGPYIQFVLGASLQQTLIDRRHSVIMIPEVGPTAILAAFVCALAGTDYENVLAEKTIKLKEGVPVLLGHGSEAIRANYTGRMEYGGMKYHQLEVRHNSKNTGKITIQNELAAALQPLDKPHSSLSSYVEFKHWEDNFAPSPLSFALGLLKSGIASPRQIFLLGKKENLKLFIPQLSPMGYSIPEWMGLRYVTTGGNESNWTGTTVDEPAIWATSSPSVARDLLISNQVDFHPDIIICDNAKTALRFHQSLSREEFNNLPTMLVLASFEERESCRKLDQAGYRLWSVPYTDIEAPLKQPPAVHLKDPVSRYIERQFAPQSNKREMEQLHHPQLEELVAHLSLLRKRYRDEEEPQIQLILFELSQLIRQVVFHPIGIIETALPKMILQLNELTRKCSHLKLYYMEINNLWSFLSNLPKESLFRKHKFTWLKQRVSEAIYSDIGVLCSSQVVAQEYKEATAQDTVFGNIKWVSLPELQKNGPYDLLIVPGWMKKNGMRRLRNCNYAAHQIFGFYPFERDWFDAVIHGNDKALKRFDREKEAIRKDIEEKYPAVPKIIWKQKPDSHSLQPDEPDSETAYPKDEGDILDFARDRITKLIEQTVEMEKNGAKTALASLVTFEDAGNYILLRPAARVINLSGALDEIGGKTTNADSITEKEAERLVDLPVKKITPGCLLAFSPSSDRNLLDALADDHLPDPVTTRTLAALWKTALIDFMVLQRLTIPQLKEQLSNAGISRDPATIAQWIDLHNPTIAPRAWKSEIPLIATLTAHAELSRKLKHVLEAVDLIYQARRMAAVRLVRHLMEYGQQSDQGTISFNVKDVKVVYETHRVMNISSPRQVSVSQIGRIMSLGNHQAQDISMPLQ